MTQLLSAPILTLWVLVVGMIFVVAVLRAHGPTQSKGESMCATSAPVSSSTHMQQTEFPWHI